MESIDSILTNPEPPEQEAAETEETTADTGSEIVAEETGVTDQVAADEAAQSYNPDQVKAELAALAKERERIRKKEAELDAAREQLNVKADGQTEEQQRVKPDGDKDIRAEIRELRKQHREALATLMIDPGDEDASVLVDQLEDRMDELRMAVVGQQQKAVSAQEKAVNEFQSVYSDLHSKYPFLATDHPQVNAELNEDINTYYAGRLQMGDSNTVALKKAVEKYAPAYANSLGGGKKNAPTSVPKKTADRGTLERLGNSAFSEVRSVGRSEASKPFTGPTPMDSILGKAA